MTVLWILLALFVLLALRVPVSFAILMPCLIYVAMDDALTMGIVIQRLASTLNSFPLVAVPLFILVGFVADASGMANRLIVAMLAIFGRLRGSLGYANVGASVGFSWMSGSATADAAAMGAIMGRTMKKHNYTGSFATGLTGAAAMIGPIMPPSVAAIIFAVLAQTSVSDMFLAGILPAFVIACSLCVYVWIHSRRKPELTSPKLTRRESAVALGKVVPILLTPVIIFGGILGGYFTPTEAASVAGVYLILLGLVTRWMPLKNLVRALRNTAETTGRVMLIATAGGMLAFVLAREGAPRDAAEAMLSLTEHPWIFLILLNIALLLLGMFLEPVSALLITVPVVMPIALEYGIDPLHLGVIMILNLSIGLLTPPVGLVLYVLGNASDTPMPDVIRGILPALVPLGIALILVTYVPILSTGIPGLAR
ncbi:TRAP transporter large permease [Nesterenkonia haasae]|uniref:TRAP transporter large permease n=1 Tax=Nesterenkonia haasae TaxID=2587813 RepID=UPI0013917041|nr:TRAP transporter large permease [Nesterenkonia haasae]NDK32488.1 TRAP transporter large permease [Nesterenkonia haasae]